jgi:GNAT superfamily N-acetyltransferase
VTKPTPHVRVRRATLDDLDTVVAFNAAMARETEGRELELGRLRAGVNAVLRDAQRGFYLLAEIPPSPLYERHVLSEAEGGVRGDWQVVGQLLITTEWSDWRNAFFWWVQSVYVAPLYRRRGVYRALDSYLRAEARRRGDICGLRLYVARTNRAAQQVYANLGMSRSDYDMYEVEFQG